MNIRKITDRNNILIKELYAVWEASVRASHSFLTEEDIGKIAGYVPAALREIEILITAENDKGENIGFAGIDGHKLEMLFLHPSYFKQGIGRRLLAIAIKEYHVTEVDVNEQNPAAKGFYERAGFEVYARDAFDGQGNPFPILHLRLK